MPLNENLGKVFEYLKVKLGLKKIPLLALSLNNKDFLEIYYQANKAMFEKYGVEIIGFAGNQVQLDKDGKVSGVIEHVTGDNKKDYIPDLAIMLADDRETAQLLQAGVNAINIQGKKFAEVLIEEAVDYAKDISVLAMLIKQRATSLSHEDKEKNDQRIEKVNLALVQSRDMRLSIERGEIDINGIRWLLTDLVKKRHER